MKRDLVIILIVIFTLLLSGCCTSKNVTRSYTYGPSENVTIYILKNNIDDLTILESNESMIKVIENVNLPWNSGSGTTLIEDYVRFDGNEKNLSIYVRLLRPSDNWPSTNDAYANILVYLPKNSSYSFVYANSMEFKWPR